MTFDDFETLIDAIYAAGADPQRWQEALSALTRITPGYAAALYVNSMDGAELDFGASHNMAVDALGPSARYYRAINPLILPAARIPAGGVVSDRDLHRDGIHAHPEYAHDFCRPFDIGGGAIMILTKNLYRFSCITIVNRWGDEPTGDAEINDLRRVMRHLQRAVDLNCRFASVWSERNAALHALDRMDIGVFLIDASGRTVHANRAGEAMLRAGDGLMLLGGKLTATHPHAKNRLARAIHEAVTGTGDRGGVVSAPLAGSPRPMLARVTPLPVEHELLPEPASLRAIVFVTDLNKVQSAPTENIKSALGLTSAEARLAMAVARGDELREVAERCKLSISTLRTQLKSVMAKTETHKQAELASLITRLATLPDQK